MLKHVVDNVNHTHEHRRDCNKNGNYKKKKHNGSTGSENCLRNEEFT